MFFWTTMLRMPFSVLRLLGDKFEGSSHIRLKIAAVERGTDKLLHKMLWFEGSIPAAIASAKQKNSVFVIFIAGDDDQSTQMLSSWEDDKVAEATAQSFVAIKIDAKSDTCVQFSQIYPVVCIPSSFFIGDNGIPLEVIAGSVPAEQLVNRIEKVKQMHIQQKNVKLGGADENQVATEQHCASLVTPDLTSQSQSLPSETVQPNGAHLSDAEPENVAAAAASKACLSKTVEEGVHSGQPSPAEEISVSSEDASVSSQPEEDLNIKVERLTKKLEERREHKNREEESEIKKEVERRKVGKEILDFKKKNEGEKTKQMLEERNREKAEEKAARDRVKQQIALDRADRAARYAKTKEEVDAAMAAALQTRQAELVAKKQTSQKERSAIARIQFRLPDGSSITNQFPSETRLEEARQFVAQEVGKKYGNFSLATMFPRREFTIEDFDKTLLELELAPSAAIVLLPQTGRSAAAVVQSSGGGIWGVLGTIFYPLFAVWRFISNFVFASSPPPGSSTRQAPQPEHSQPSTSTAAEPKRETIRKRVLEKHTDDFKKDGKIYRLRTQGDNEDDNNTWNGNSTQQM